MQNDESRRRLSGVIPAVLEVSYAISALFPEKGAVPPRSFTNTFPLLITGGKCRRQVKLTTISTVVTADISVSWAL